MYLSNYVKQQGSIHLFKIIGMLKAENIKLIKNYLWNTLGRLEGSHGDFQW